MFPFFSFLLRLQIAVSTLLLAMPVQLAMANVPEAVEAAAVVAEPAPSAGIPLPVAIRADHQPVALAPVEKPSSASRLRIRSQLAMFLDETGGIGVEEASARLSEFTLYSLGPLERRVGALWLYLDLGAVNDSAPHTLWLDLGEQAPAHVSVWSSADGRAWKNVSPENRGLYGLSGSGRRGQVLIRMDGLPGLWFEPSLRSLRSAMDSPERRGHTLTLAALSLLGVLCLLLSITERGEGRFWTGVLAAAAVVQALWAIPSTPHGSIGAEAFPGIFSAGVALFMLPHVGRVLMRTGHNSPSTDILFLLLALPGACAALLPLLPGMAWTARLLVLWPLAALLYIVPTLLLLVRGVQGSGLFMLACLAMGGGAAASLWGIARNIDSSVWGLAVQAGPVLGLLFLASAAPHRQRGDSFPSLAQDVLLRRTVESKSDIYKGSSPVTVPCVFQGIVDELLDEACRLDQALTRSGAGEDKVEIMAHADSMVSAARRLSDCALGLPPAAELPAASQQIFELRKIIQAAFASVFDEAEKKGLGLAWYIAPHLGQFYKGDSPRLTALLSLLLADSVRASSHGAVSLHVRRTESSVHPGHLQFTVTDNGEEVPPRGRESMLLSRAWELASAYGGELFVGSTLQGMELTFSMECVAMEDDGITERTLPPAETGETPAPDSSLIILASSESLNRQLYSYYLEGMGFRIWEARDAEEAAALYFSSPSALVILDGCLGEDDMVQGLATIRMFEGEQALPAVPFLLLARDDTQAERIGKAGCDESLIQPIVRRDLRAMAKWLTSPGSDVPRPVLTTQRVTLAAVLAGAHSGVRMQRKAIKKSGPALSETEKVENESAAVFSSVMEGEQQCRNSEEGAALTLEMDPLQSEKKEGGWLSSLFRSQSRRHSMPDMNNGEGHGKTEDSRLDIRDGSENEIVDLLAEHVLVGEKDICELTEADREIAGEVEEQESRDIGSSSDGVIDLGNEFIRENRTEFEGNISGRSGEKIGSEKISASVLSPGKEKTFAEVTEGLDFISSALIRGDVQAIRTGARGLCSIAEKYELHTLADMARCFRAAWEDGDVDAAAQIVEEMRGETLRSQSSLQRNA